MDNLENGPVTAHLALCARRGLSAEQISDAVISAWQEIHSSLSPILGHGGIEALYGRSIYLTSPDHPCLRANATDAGTAMDLANLKSILARQNSADAAAAGGTLLQNFHTLLTSLVGPQLTERLLRPAWENLLGDRSAQDKIP